MAKYKLNENYNATSNNIAQTFSKGDVIDGIIIESNIVSTKYDGKLPNIEMVGEAWFPIPLLKLTKVDDATPIFVQRVSNYDKTNKYNYKPIPANKTNQTCEELYLKRLRKTVVQTKEEIEKEKQNYIENCKKERGEIINKPNEKIETNTNNTPIGNMNIIKKNKTTIIIIASLLVIGAIWYIQKRKKIK